MNSVIDFVRVAINEHKETIQQDNSRDFIDVYLQEINKTTDTSSSFYGPAAGTDNNS